MKYGRSVPDSKDVPILFKYREFNDRSIESILKSTLWFASPSTFNDPFDCNLDIKEDLTDDEQIRLHAKIAMSLDMFSNKDIAKNTILYGTNSEYKKDMDKRIRELLADGANDRGVFCFSESHNVSLMWSHYSDSHKGLCIGYERTDENQLGDDDFSRPVNYSSNPYIPFSKVFDDSGHISNMAVDSIMYTKDPNWHYEKEWRMLSEESGVEKLKDLGTKIVRIYFGLKMPEWQKISIASLMKATDVELYEMHRSPESFDLGDRPYILQD